MAASPNKDRYRRYSGGSGGGGGLSRLLANLANSGDTVEENQPANTAAIYGDEGDKKFVDKKGQQTGKRYGDSRGFFAKAFGAPNNAEDLNLEISRQEGLLPGQLEEQRRTGELKTELDVNRAQTLGPVEAYNAALMSVAQKYGVPPQQAEKMFPMQVEAMASSLAADTSRNVTARSVEEAGRGGRVATARNTADMAALTSENLLNWGRNNPRAMDAASAADVLRGPAQLQKILDIEAGPESTLYRQGEIPELRRLFGSGSITGSREERYTIPGKPIGNTGYNMPDSEGRRVIPGRNNIDIPIDESVLGRRGQPQAAVLEPIATDVGPMTKPLTPQSLLNRNIGTPQMSASGEVSAPLRPPEETPEQKLERKQREEKEAQDIIRRLLSSPIPHSGNRINR